MRNKKLLHLLEFVKTSATVLALALFLVFNFIDANAQDDPETKKLEAQLKQLENESDSVEVDIDGDEERTGTVTFTVKRKIPVNTSEKSRDNSGVAKTKTKRVTLPTIDLRKINLSTEDVTKKIDALLSSEAMCGVIPAVNVVQMDASIYWKVTDDYVYNPGAYKITVPKTFVYDRASIPRIFWSIGLDKDSLGNVAPLIHDLLYRHEGELPANLITPSNKKFSRKEADDLFLELMQQCGVSKVRRNLAYQAVRKFSGFAWKKRPSLTD